MSKTYMITEEDIVHAASYIPAADKVKLVRALAERCFDRLDISTGTGRSAALPPKYKVNTDARARYLMGVLVKSFLGKDFESDDDTGYLMSITDYDMYAGGHPLETINRMKSDASLRDKVFDMLSDYSEIRYRLDADIEGLRDAMNDPVARLLAYVEASSSPDEMKKTLEEMNANKALLEEYMSNKSGG